MVDGELCVESEEVVVESNTFGFDDYKYFRAMNTLFHAIFINGLHLEFFRRLVAGGASLTDFLERLLVSTGGQDYAAIAHNKWLGELDVAMDLELYDDEHLANIIAEAKAGRMDLPSEIKIQPIFARKLSDNEHGWVARIIERLARDQKQMVA